MSSKIVEEPITPFQFLELVGYDLLECLANQSAFSGPLRHGSDEQIDIVHRLVQTLEFSNDLKDDQIRFDRQKQNKNDNNFITNLCGDEIEEIVESLGARKTAQSAVRIVTRET